MSGLELSTVTACGGTFCAAGPELRRSKGSPDEVSILEAARVLAQVFGIECGKGTTQLEVGYLNRSIAVKRNPL